MVVTGEFAAIAGIRAALPDAPDPREVWIGDDAAVLNFPAGHRLLFAADTVVAGVHADLALTTLDDLGWKALVAAVSDVAAMGGEPGFAVVTVAGPPGTDLAQLYEGLGAAAAASAVVAAGTGLGLSQTNMSSRERSSAAAGRTSTSASDCAGSRVTLTIVPTG